MLPTDGQSTWRRLRQASVPFDGGSSRHAPAPCLPRPVPSQKTYALRSLAACGAAPSSGRIHSPQEHHW
eukprot:6907929-Prymnesium_polylepis.1